MTILEMRKEMGLTQRKFAEHFGIPVTNVSHWEQGVSSPPEYVIGLIQRVFDLEKRIGEVE